MIAIGLSFSGYLIYNSTLDWENNQAITTLESIATPIQDVQFPTVTVCPHENTKPDNWSFLEKILNALNFNSNIVKQGIINPIISKILANVEKKFRDSPNSTMWRKNIQDEQNCDTEYGNVLVQAANYLCQKKFNVNDLRKNIIENYAIQYSYLDALNQLADFDRGLDCFDYYHCNTSCCENWQSREFFHGIINAGYFIYSQKIIGLGTFQFWTSCWNSSWWTLSRMELF